MHTQVHLNGFFNLNRWYCFLCADLRLNWKRYLLVFAGMSVLMYLFFLWRFAIDINTRHIVGMDYFDIFMMGLLALCLFVGSHSPEFNDKTRAAHYLLLPASTFEKIWTQALIYVVFGIICYLLIFWMDIHLARWTVLSWESVRVNQVDVKPFKYAMLWWDIGASRIIYMAWMAIGLFMFSMRLFFKRYAVLKSGIVLFGLYGLGMCCMVGLSHLFYAETQGFDPYVPIYNVYGNVTNVEIFWFIISCCVYLAAIPLAYFKHKEKEA